MNVELRHLRYFLAVAEELHFGRAADRLRIAQPSLSQQIRRLEEEIDTELFDRTHRRVALTPAGEALVPGAKRTLEDARAAIDRTREAGAGITGHLTVGFIELAAISVVPEAVRRFHATHPRVGVTLLGLGVETQIEGLISGRLDLGFLRVHPNVDGLVTKTVLEERLVVALPAGHRLADRSSLSMSHLETEPLIAVERPVLPELYDDTIEMLRVNGDERDFAQEASSVLAVLGLVSAGLGLAVLPASVQDLRLKETVFIPMNESPLAALLVASNGESTSIHVQDFLHAVQEGASRIR